MTDPFEISRKIRLFAETQLFKRYAESLALKIVTQLFTDTGRTWRQAARENSKGRIIYEALRNELKGPIGGSVAEQVQRNAQIIKTLPIEISSKVTDYIAAETFNGRRAYDIAKEIKSMFPESSKAKANLIARTEVSKTQFALTQARAENMGINWYVWKTSEDSRVRSSHKHMDDVLVKWSDPPSPEALIGKKSTLGHYHAGCSPNCRCYPEPLVSLDLIQWPHKVYYSGSIQTMTKSQFEAIAA